MRQKLSQRITNFPYSSVSTTLPEQSKSRKKNFLKVIAIERFTFAESSVMDERQRMYEKGNIDKIRKHKVYPMESIVAL